jgi:hypothetical protein|tara:strand:- start:1562 stop:2236 length:675 start_codon:yes stop_codon:yes gene_type:complete
MLSNQANSEPDSANSRIFLAALLAGILPFLIINSNYLIAASEGFVPWCVPYWDSCTSISATGHEGTGFYFFKATMIPMAFLYMWYWRLVKVKLTAFGYRGTAIPTLGIIASLALLCYTLALGAVGDSFSLTRRIGVIFYFTFVYLSQLLIVYRVGKLAIPDPSRLWQLLMCLLILSVGVSTLLLDALIDNYDDYDDAFEWVLALLLHVNFLLGAWGWRTLGKPV